MQSIPIEIIVSILTLEQTHSQFDCVSKFETQYREHLSSHILHIS